MFTGLRELEIEEAGAQNVPAREGADGVEVGEQLRAIRNLRRITLRSLSARTGLSLSFLSQVERGRSNASLASLQRIARGLGVSIADLFDPDGSQRSRVLRRENRPELAFGILGRKFLLTPRPLQNLEVFVGQLEPEGSTGDEPYAHGDSEEMFLVLDGLVHIQLGTDIYVMRTGDSITYRSSIVHRVSNAGSDRAEVLWIISPPSY